jgi:predicted nucleotide-binding protein (sugar kinase/HSP70/actin superfamily)
MDGYKNKIKIGIPRGLLFYKYNVFWKEFFEGLGCDIIISPETNKEILSKGTNLAVDESCLSVKIFLGHVDYLKDKADCIFIPHFVSIYRGERMCVKFWGIYDITQNTFPDLNIIDCTIDADNFKTHFLGYFKLGLKLKKDPITIIKAYLKAKKAEKEYLAKTEEKQQDKIKNRKQENPSVLIVSHPYTTYDGLLGKPITGFLETLGVNIIYSDVLNDKNARKLANNISTDVYWTYNKDLLAAIEYYKNNIDGIIFLMTFPCGPDSMVINLCQHKLKIPMTVLVLDELQGEAGLKTRLESFIDILKLRKTNAAIA